MTNLNMKKEQLEKLIAKYYREELDSEGTVKLTTTRHYEIRDYVYEPVATLRGNMQLGDETFEIEKKIDKKEIEEIIKFYFEQAGYEINRVYFSVDNDYHNNNANCTGATMEIKQKVKTKGGI